MKPYNLNDNVNESFEFIIGEHHYTMRYPLLGEIEDEQAKIAKLEEEGRAEAITNWMYSYIKPVGEAPDVKEALKSQNIKVVARFNEMLSEEFKEFING